MRMPCDVEMRALGPIFARPRMGLAYSFYTVVLFCCEPRRPSAGLVDSLPALLGQNNREMKQQKRDLLGRKRGMSCQSQEAVKLSHSSQYGEMSDQAENGPFGSSSDSLKWVLVASQTLLDGTRRVLCSWACRPKNENSVF